MPVSTRSKRKRWPPSGDDETIILPESIYWNYIRPFTPVKDRAVLNKRSGSTQFYAGDRAEIDSSFLAKHGGVLRFTGIPHAMGEPGSSDFRMAFDERSTPKYDEADPEAALELLREARRAWDRHLSNISGPTERLHACLKLFVDDNHPNTPVELPLFFVGEGTVQDVVGFHAAMNPRSVHNILEPQPGWRHDLPGSLLGYWVNRFLSSAICDAHDGIRSTSADQEQEVVRALLAAGADVAPFFVNLHNYAAPINPSYARFFEPGMDLLDCMIRYAEWWEDASMEYEEGAGEYIYGLRWMIEQLIAKFRG